MWDAEDAYEGLPSSRGSVSGIEMETGPGTRESGGNGQSPAEAPDQERLFTAATKANRISGGDALTGHTRSHPEHDG